MPRHIACLTFDFDVWSGWTARGMTTPTPVSRGEFGLIGARRIVDLLAQHGIRSTWCVPGVIIDTHGDACERVVAAGHEIAHHGYSHVPPANLAPEREEEEMVRACDSIERLTGPPRGYRSPAWDLSPVTIELLLKHGFDYESSMMGNDHMPYFARQGDQPTVDRPFVFGAETRLVELPISWTLDDYPHFEFVRTQTGPAGADEHRGRAAELARRFPLHDACHRLGHADLYLPSLRDRPRPPHADARAPDRGPARDGRRLPDDGAGGRRVSLPQGGSP